jgi:hypothetical protein
MNEPSLIQQLPYTDPGFTLEPIEAHHFHAPDEDLGGWLSTAR